MLVVLWSFTVSIISLLPLYLIVLKPHLKRRCQIRLQERIKELKELVEIENGLMRFGPDETTRVDYENKLLSLNNELSRLEQKLARKTR